MDKCKDCGGQIEKGAMLDYTYGGVLAQRYSKTDNLPQGKNKAFMGMREADFQDIRRINAFRCIKCNRVYLYAQEIIAAKNTINVKPIILLLVMLAFIFLCLTLFISYTVN